MFKKFDNSAMCQFDNLIVFCYRCLIAELSNCQIISPLPF